MSVSRENKVINKALRNVFSGDSHYSKYADEEEINTIDILSCSDSPSAGLTSFGTLGLSDYSIGKEIDGVPLGVEFVGTCRSEFNFFPNIIATCAFNIINSKYKCEPGTIFEKIVGMYIDSPMKHILFTNPFVWAKKLETLYLQPNKIVAWLLMVPISDTEYEYSILNSVEKLESLFDKEEIDLFDPFRKSVL